MTDTIVHEKTCRACQQTKPITEFFKNRAYRLSICRTCTGIKSRARYARIHGVRAVQKIQCACERCSKEFLAAACWVKRGGGRFCSRACCDAYKREHKQESVPTVNHKAEVTSKRCTECGTIKTLDQFRKHKKGITSACISCLNDKCRDYHRKHHPFEAAPDLPGETWKPVIGYEHLYAVSNMGRIKRTTPGRGTNAGRVIELIL